MNYDYHSQINNNTGIVNNFTQPTQKQGFIDPYLSQVKHPPPQTQPQQIPMQVQYNTSANSNFLNKLRIRYVKNFFFVHH